MSEFEELLSGYFEKSKEIKVGNIITPEIIGKNYLNLIVDLKFKSDGYANLKEIENIEGKNFYNIGDTIPLYIVSLDDGFGNSILSYEKASKINARESIKNSLNDNSFIEVTISNETPRGLVATFKSIECFIPKVLCSLSGDENISGFVGKKVKVKIIKFSEDSNSIIASHKHYLEKESGIDKEKVISELSENDIINVRIKNIVKYGAFVSYKSVDALLYIKDISWFNINSVEDFLKKNDNIDVIVKKIDIKKEQVSVSLKDLDTSPWDKLANNYKVGDIVPLSVVDLNKHGIYVRYNNSIDFFIHKSNLNNSFPNDFKLDDEIEAIINDINHFKRIITFIKK